MIVYIEDPKDYTKHLLELIGEFSKIAECKINIQKSFAFYTLIMNYQKAKKKYHLQLHKKIKYLGINLTKDLKYLY